MIDLMGTRCRSKKWVWLALVFFVGAGLRIYFLEGHSLWVDELFTWHDCWQPSFSEFWKTFARLELSPPLFFLVEFLFSRFLEAREWTIRLPSLLFGIGFMGSTFLFARELSRQSSVDRDAPKVSFWVGLLAAAFVATSYKSILFSQEARNYSMLMFLTSLLGWSWLRLVSVAGSPTLRSSEAKTYLLVATATAYTHYFGVLMIVSHALTIPLVKKLSKREFFAWVKVYAVAALAYVPWIIFLLVNGIPNMSMIKSSVPFSEIFVAHRELFGSSSVNSILALILALVAIFSKSSWRPRTAVLLWVFLPFVLALMVSAVRPIYSTRYYMLALSPMLAVAALGTLELRKWRRALPAVVAIAFCLLGLHQTFVSRAYYRTPRAEQVREATAVAIEMLRENPDAGFVLLEMPPVLNEFYIKRLNSPRTFDFTHPKADILADPQLWPAGMKEKSKLIVVIVSYRDLDTVFHLLPQPYQVQEKRDFHLATVGLIVKNEI